MPVNMAAKFGKKNQAKNGLNDIAEMLGEAPQVRRLVVAVIECARTVINHENQDEESQAVRIVHVEAAITAAEEKKLRAVLDARYRARTGKSPEPELPFDEAGDDRDEPADGQPTDEVPDPDANDGPLFSETEV